MKHLLLPLCIIGFVASPTLAQTPFWENLNGQTDSVVQRTLLSNGVQHLDTVHVGDSVRVDTFSTYDTAYNNDNIGTSTFMSQRSVYQIVVLPTGEIVMTTDLGIMRSSDNAQSWTISNTGISPTYQPTGLCLGHDGVLYIGQYFHFYRSRDKGVTWDSLPCKELTGGAGLLRYSSRGTIFTIDGGGNTWKTSNEGQSWTSVHYGGYSTAFYSIDVTPSGTLFGADGNGLWRSTNDGTTWTQLFTTTINSSGPTRWVNFGIGASGTVIAAVDAGGSYQYEQSTDDGITWSVISGWTDTNLGYRVIGMAPTNSVVIGGYNNSPSTPFALFGANTSTGLRDVVTGVRQYFVVFAFDSLGHAYGGTQGGGLFRSSVTFSSVSPNSNRLYSDNVHSYPNPVSLSAQIMFNAQATGHADVTILNLLGTEVTNLFSGELQTGEHTFQWNPNPSLSDGMYECLIRMNGEIYRQSTLLVR